MSSKNINSQIIAELSARPVAYNPILAKIGKGACSGVFLSQILYWCKKGTDEEWTFKTIAEFEEETGLTRSEQETAIRRWKELGVLKVQLKGVPAKRNFNVDLVRLHDLLIAHLELHQFVTNPQPSLRQSDKLVCDKPATQFATNPQTLYEHKSTTENTTEITAQTTSEKSDVQLEVKNSSNSVEASNIVLVMEKFQKTVNPTLNYGHRSHRKAAADLIEKMGIDKTLRAIEYACSVQGEQYAPVITTPSQLKEKLGMLVVYMQRQGSSNKRVKIS